MVCTSTPLTLQTLRARIGWATRSPRTDRKAHEQREAEHTERDRAREREEEGEPEVERQKKSEGQSLQKKMKEEVNQEAKNRVSQGKEE